MKKVRFVRIYLTEKDSIINDLMSILQNKDDILGATVFTAKMGYGVSGKMHQASLIDLALDQPLVVEFFAEDALAQQAIEDIRNLFGQSVHVVSWEADSHDD